MAGVGAKRGAFLWREPGREELHGLAIGNGDVSMVKLPAKEVADEFAASPNETNIQVGSGDNLITVASKKGWEYLEVLYKEGTETIGGRVIQIPAQANVHRIFNEKDFSKLKIGVM